MSGAAPGSGSTRERFAAAYAFPFDDFQVEALDALDAGRSVVVAAPTGSGKTIVAEYAVAKALAEGGKAFYTTPIKALSNQKYGDLVRRHGADKVGLLTGDNAVNDGAPVIVMTTEVLRNMIYARSNALRGLRYVVLDEVHYLQDAYRGPVWEEVIIHTPPEVDLVCLSATVSNAEELAEWVTSVRGDTAVVIHEVRPVELTHLYLVGDRDTGEVVILPTFVDGLPNPEASQFDADGGGGAPWRSARRRRVVTPRRTEVIEALRMEDLLPALYFIFSRAACDDAVRACLAAGMRLTTRDERLQIRDLVEARMRDLSDADLRVLDYAGFVAGLEAGIAAHHAGMVPPFKEAVEACFARGLVKAVFATETLALGINMPARAVVIEKLSKFGGERHEFLTPGEYTQLTGRAGRRGIDPVGYAAALWSPFVPFDQVASLASARSYELRSAFRPTYNMAVNLVRRYSPENAHHLLKLSFAQFHVDADLLRLNRDAERIRSRLGDARADAHCDLGDVEEYRRLVERRRAPVRPVAEIEEALRSLQPGDVIALPDGGQRPPAGRRDAGTVVVIATLQRRDRPAAVKVVTATGRVLELVARDFRSLPERLVRARLPVPYNPKSRSFQKDAASALVRATGKLRRGRDGAQDADDDGPVHPVERCPDLSRHLRAAAKVEQLSRDLQRVTGLATARATSLVDQFDRVLGLLEERGYLDGWALTDDGRVLCGLFHECDLLIAECLSAGLFDRLPPPQVAALASVFVYEARRSSAPPGGRGRDERDGRDGRGGRDGRRGADEPVKGMPKPLLSRWFAIEETATALAADEREIGLPATRLPDPGFAQIAQSWASGRPLSRVLDPTEVTGGDFVRTVKALIDLLRQIGQVANDPDTAAAARAAADGLFRGVVAAASSVGTVVDAEEPSEEVAAVHAADVAAADVAAPLDAVLRVLEAHDREEPPADAPGRSGEGGHGVSSS